MKVKYDHFCWGGGGGGGPKPQANMDPQGFISASTFGPGGTYPLVDLDPGG